MDDVLGVTRPGVSSNGAAFKNSRSDPRLRAEQSKGVISGAEFAALVRQRRRRKFVRFAVAEAVAIVVLVGSLIAGLSAPFAAESLTPFFRVVPIGAALVATVVPIVFFGNPMRR